MGAGRSGYPAAATAVRPARPQDWGETAAFRDFIALPTMATVGDALARVRESPLLQPEALTSVHAVDDDGCLRGVARLVTLVQADPAASVIEVSSAACSA